MVYNVRMAERDYQVMDAANKVHQLKEAIGAEKSGMSRRSTLGVREERKDLLREYRKMSPEKRRTVRKDTLERVSLLREFDRHFLEGREVNIDLEELGVQRSHLVKIKLESAQVAAEKRRNILIIPAFGGDKYGLISLMRELALQGHTVSCLDYPESWNGEPTMSFAKAVEEAAADSNRENMYGPHVRFFKKGIEMVKPDEVWGYSTSAGFLPKLIEESGVKTGVAIAPTSMVDQTKSELIAGFGPEVFAGGNFWPDQGVVLGPRVKRSPEFMKNRTKIVAGLMTEVCRRLPEWTKLKLGEGKRLILVSGTRDGATKSHKGIEELGLEKIDGVKVVNKPWTHVGMLTHARELVNEVANLRESE